MEKTPPIHFERKEHFIWRGGVNTEYLCWYWVKSLVEGTHSTVLPSGTEDLALCKLHGAIIWQLSTSQQLLWRSKRQLQQLHHRSEASTILTLSVQHLGHGEPSCSEGSAFFFSVWNFEFLRPWWMRTSLSYPRTIRFLCVDSSEYLFEQSFVRWVALLVYESLGSRSYLSLSVLLLPF